MVSLQIERNTVAHTRQRGLFIDRPLDSGVAGKGLAGWLRRFQDTARGR